MAHVNCLRLKVQQSTFWKLTANNADCHSIFNMLTSEKLLNQVESLLPTHRERMFPPTATLSMFVAQVLNQDRSCQIFSYIEQNLNWHWLGRVRGLRFICPSEATASAFTAKAHASREREPWVLVGSLSLQDRTANPLVK